MIITKDGVDCQALIKEDLLLISWFGPRTLFNKDIELEGYTWTLLENTASPYVPGARNARYQRN
jgi:hypothetical protein